jgi:hypothetical protein
MLPFGVIIPATVPQGSEIPEGLMNNPVQFLPSHFIYIVPRFCHLVLLFFLSTSNKMQRYTIFFINVNAVYVWGGFSAHH